MTLAERPSRGPEPPLRVLVVDDSAVMRQVLVALLTEGGMEVQAASDPIIALEKMQKVPPDVIVLDLEMPRMDGLTFLRRLRVERPTPVVICSGVAQRGTELALRALEEGAVEVISKPKVGVRDFLFESALVLLDAVRAAAASRPRVRRAAPATAAVAPASERDTPVPAPGPLAMRRRPSNKIVAIGASTGGTEAISQILQAMPKDGPPLVIVQHMPEPFTTAFAARLDGLCRIQVKEAVSGDPIRPGTALIAPGNRHLRIRRSPTGFIAEVTDGAMVSRHRPSVDELFRSVADVAGAGAIGVLLTGMGEDGASGLYAMRKSGARTFAQDEASSVVYGMPKAAVDRGAVEEIVSLGRMAAAILRRA